MPRKKTPKQRKQADKKRREMSVAKKRNDPVRDILKRTLGQMPKDKWN